MPGSAGYLYRRVHLRPRTSVGAVRGQLRHEWRARFVTARALRNGRLPRVTKRLPHCRTCGASIEHAATGRPRAHCSSACRQRAYNHRARKARRIARSDWWTPPDLAERVTDRHGIRLDGAANAVNRLVPDYLCPDHVDKARCDALGFRSWDSLANGGAVWVNPPYSPTPIVRGFLMRAAATAAAGTEITALLPHSVSTRWWAELVEAPGARIEPLGRLVFQGGHATGLPAPFPSALLVYEPRRGLVDRLVRLGSIPVGLLRS